MWCSVYVTFMSTYVMSLFPLTEMGDTEVSDNTVTCYGNHRLIQDVLSWVECESDDVVKVIVDFDDTNTTYLYNDGVKVYEVSEEQEGLG